MNNWISVSDRLPEHDRWDGNASDWVLVWHGGYKDFGRHWKGDSCSNWEIQGHGYSATVVYWLEVDDPPVKVSCYD